MRASHTVVVVVWPRINVVRYRQTSSFSVHLPSVICGQTDTSCRSEVNQLSIVTFNVLAYLDPVRVLTFFLAIYRLFLIRIFPLFDICTINLSDVDRQSL